MAYQLLNVLVFAAVGIVFVAVTVGIVGRIVRPKLSTRSEPAKEETYECGEPALGSSWVRFDNRFYAVALVFLVFDVEVALLYPWALVFKSLSSPEEGAGLFVFAEAVLFLAVLGAGFVYCWAKGDLDWIKSNPPEADRSKAAARERLEPAKVRRLAASAAGASEGLVRSAGAPPPPANHAGTES